MKSTIQDKNKIVNSVFSEVHKKYDLMNDIMSFGVHRTWKKKFVDWMQPQFNSKLIDVAAGTGDIARLFLNKSNNTGEITCIEPNIKMLEQGKKKQVNLKIFFGLIQKRKKYLQTIICMIITLLVLE